MTTKLHRVAPSFSHLKDSRDVIAHLSGWFGALADNNCALAPEAAKVLAADLWLFIETTREADNAAKIAKILRDEPRL